MTSPSNTGFKRSPPYWLLIAAGSLLPAVLNAFTAYLNSRLGRGRADWAEVLFALIDWLFLGALTPIVYVLARRFPLRRDRIGRTIQVHIGGALVLCLAWALLGVSLGRLMHRIPTQNNFWRSFLIWILFSLPWSVFLYFLLLGCVYAFSYYREARERESQQARLGAQLAEARLGALRMQLNPHFLFNSLNAITVLVRDQNTHDASRMLELLSGVLRQVLHGNKRSEVTLDDEISFIERYLAIEQVRFSDRLQVRWSIEPAVHDVLVPEFILQPLVENAVRHGVAKLTDGGSIWISARHSDGNLELCVEDNGPGYNPTSEAGVGLDNTRARLEALFDGKGRLLVQGAESNGTVAIIQLPLRRAADG